MSYQCADSMSVKPRRDREDRYRQCVPSEVGCTTLTAG